MRDPRYPAPEDFHARIDAIEARAHALVSGMDDELQRRRPAAGGWSVSEVLGHLVTTADAYAVECRRALARPGLPAGDPARWSCSFVGGFIMRSLVSPRRMPAPRALRPVEVRGSGSLDEFLRTMRELRQLLEQSRGLDWNRVRLRSPVSSLIRLRLGEALATQVLHAERHLAQGERVKSEVGVARHPH